MLMRSPTTDELYDREEFIKYLSNDLISEIKEFELSDDEIFERIKHIFIIGWKAGYFDCNTETQDLRLKGKL